MAAGKGSTSWSGSTFSGAVPWATRVARRERSQQFWGAIARGSPSEAAAVEVGVSPAVGTRWFREAGGMPSVSQLPESGRHLSFAEREELAILHAHSDRIRGIAKQLGRSHQRSRGSCDATPPPVAAPSGIAPRPRSGKPIGAPGDRRWPSSPRTTR